MSPSAAPALPNDIANNSLLSDWIRIAADGVLEVYAGKVELGQGIHTTLLQIAADELDVLPAAIRLYAGNTATCPDQGLTSGSQSTEVGAMSLRLVCAEVRQCFVQAAAQRLRVLPHAIRIEDGLLFAHGDGVHVQYADLVADVDLASRVTGGVAPKLAAQRRVCGTSTPRPDLLRKLFGAAYIHDIDLPGMVHARMVRPPSYGARLQGIGASARLAVLALPGVQSLLIDGRYVGVCATREEQAIAAAVALSSSITWEEQESLPLAAADQHWLRTLAAERSLLNAAAPVPSHDSVPVPVPVPAPGPAARHIEVDYSRPFLAHASIGPSCGLATWKEGALTVWTHAQGSFTLRRELALLFDLSVEVVTVIHVDGAGCYGHNGADDAAIDAAMLARACGRPVRLLWSREDEFAWAPFGPAMSVRIAAALDAQGRIAAWHHQTWSQTHVQRPGTRPGLSCLAARHREQAAPPPPTQDFGLPAGGGQRNALPLYDLPEPKIEYHLVQSQTLRSSALRALGAYANVFAIESCMDELALLAGQDPLAFRLAHLSDPRAIEVLSAVARDSGWHQDKAPANRQDAMRGRGIGFARYKNSSAYCAVVVEIEVAERIILDKIWSVVDAGEVINPDGAANQVEGGILQAASWTLKECVQWDAMRVTTRSWENYPILGFDEAPNLLQVNFISRLELPPLGVGECAAGPTAAAIANALSDALGLRMRDLPLTPERLLQAVRATSGDDPVATGKCGG